MYILYATWYTGMLRWNVTGDDFSWHFPPKTCMAFSTATRLHPSCSCEDSDSNPSPKLALDRLVLVDTCEINSGKLSFDPQDQNPTTCPQKVFSSIFHGSFPLFFKMEIWCFAWLRFFHWLYHRILDPDRADRLQIYLEEKGEEENRNSLSRCVVPVPPFFVAEFWRCIPRDPLKKYASQTRLGSFCKGIWLSVITAWLLLLGPGENMDGITSQCCKLCSDRWSHRSF